MEAKTILRLIKDDIAHLEDITSEFNSDPMPSQDEVELALVRSKTLLRELELLYKHAVRFESTVHAILPFEEPKVELFEHSSIKILSDELFDQEDHDEEHLSEMMQDMEDEQLQIDEEKEIELSIVNQEEIEERLEVSFDDSQEEEHFSALTEPAEPAIQEIHEVEDSVGEEPVIESPMPLVEPAEAAIIESENLTVNEEVDGFFTPVVEPEESIIPELENTVVIEEIVDEPAVILNEPSEISEVIQNDVVEDVIEAVSVQEIPLAEENIKVETFINEDVPEHKEEIVAEEFSEVKKTLNETLGEPHKLVNDILSTDKIETGFQIIPINSIWDGIGINDRFLFIRELFANSSAKFETTVATLDKLATIHDAVNYLKMNFKWNKTEASHKFLDLVKRRFTK